MNDLDDDDNLSMNSGNNRNSNGGRIGMSQPSLEKQSSAGGSHMNMNVKRKTNADQYVKSNTKIAGAINHDETDLQGTFSEDQSVSGDRRDGTLASSQTFKKNNTQRSALFQPQKKGSIAFTGSHSLKF